MRHEHLDKINWLTEVSWDLDNFDIAFRLGENFFIKFNSKAPLRTAKNILIIAPRTQMGIFPSFITCRIKKIRKKLLLYR